MNPAQRKVQQLLTFRTVHSHPALEGRLAQYCDSGDWTLSFVKHTKQCNTTVVFRVAYIREMTFKQILFTVLCPPSS